MRHSVKSKNKNEFSQRYNGWQKTDHKDSTDIVIFGRKPVLEIIKHQKRRIKKLYLREGAKLDREFAVALKSMTISQQVVSAEELDVLTGFGRHQGIALSITPREELTLENLIKHSLQRNKLIVVLDEVTDPHNLGAVMRSAETSGADGLIVTTDRSAKLTSAAMRASAGACEFIPIVSIGNLQRTLKELKKAGYWIVGLDAGESANDLYATTIPFPLAVVLGSEGKGIRALTAKECDLLVAIPMEGFIESLNVSQAASVFLYEMLRRRQGQ